MSVTTRNPLRMAGAQVSSGGVATGELLTVRGGSVSICIFSGNANLSGVLPSCATPYGTPPSAGGYDLLLISGAGRLNSILPHTQIVSGLSVIFYDGAVATSGGPFAASGHKIVGALPQTLSPAWVPSASGVTIFGPYTGQPYNVDIPFQSGLIVAMKSGQAGFTATFCVEVNVPTAG